MSTTRGPRIARGAALLVAQVLGLLLVGCGPEDVPTYTTSLGLDVWVYGREVSSDEVDAAVRGMLEEFEERFPRGAAEQALRGARVSFLAEDTYPLLDQQVAGNLSLDGNWMYVGAGTRALHQTAFVHELVHYLDLKLAGTTDDTHASWKGRVEKGIAKVNAALARQERAVEGVPPQPLVSAHVAAEGVPCSRTLPGLHGPLTTARPRAAASTPARGADRGSARG